RLGLRLWRLLEAFTDLARQVAALQQHGRLVVVVLVVPAPDRRSSLAGEAAHDIRHLALGAVQVVERLRVGRSTARRTRGALAQALLQLLKKAFPAAVAPRRALGLRRCRPARTGRRRGRVARRRAGPAGRAVPIVGISHGLGLQLCEYRLGKAAEARI